MIGGLSTFLIVLLIGNSLFIYLLYGQLELNYKNLESEINGLKADTQSKFNDLTDSVLETKQGINNLSQEFGSIDQQFAQLKASAGADFSGIIENSVKGVVTVKTDVSQGSGFIISKDGYVVTNYHVMEGAKAAGIYTYDNKLHSVQLIGSDQNMDISLLKINGTYDYLTLGNSNTVQIGEEVIAIGNPLGLEFSVSQGIVSGVHRPGPNGENAYIQTDAALNPGNSGGPLIDKSGNVIGINNFKIGGGENLGFALESNYLKEAVNNIAMQSLNQTLI
jgi:S1-C subfamily serine protease